MRDAKGYSFTLLALLVAFLLGLPSATAGRTTRRFDNAWEAYMGNNMMLAYYSLGILGDIYRSRVYPRAKTSRCLKMIRTLLAQEKLFLKGVKPRGSRGRKLFRKIQAVIDMLILMEGAFKKYVTGREAAALKKFAVYRQAAVEQIQKIFRDPSLSKHRRYRGGRKGAAKRLGHYLGLDLAYGYLLLGMIADGYFRQAFSKKQARQYLIPIGRLLQQGFRQLKNLSSKVHPADRAYISRLGHGSRAMVAQAVALEKYMRTRNRAQLKRFQQQRRRAWRYLAPLAQR